MEDFLVVGLFLDILFVGIAYATLLVVQRKG